MAAFPMILPPSPLDTFLQTPIPDLSFIRPGHPLWPLSHESRATEAEGDSPEGWLRRALFLRDQCHFAEAHQLLVANGEAVTDPIRYDSDTITFEGRHVLLAEDNPVNVLLASGHLERLGFKVTVAEDGSAALRLMETFAFDLVLMDVRMPVLDGLLTTMEIRKREKGLGHRIPIIAITAGAFADERDEWFEAGMDDYLGKPFTIESLRTMLCRWFPCDVDGGECSSR